MKSGKSELIIKMFNSLVHNYISISGKLNFTLDEIIIVLITVLPRIAPTVNKSMEQSSRLKRNNI